MLAAARLVRFGIETGLAARYGRRILIWMQTPVFQAIVGALIVLAVVGTVVSAVAALRARRTRSGEGGDQELRRI